MSAPDGRQGAILLVSRVTEQRKARNAKLAFTSARKLAPQSREQNKQYAAISKGPRVAEARFSVTYICGWQSAYHKWRARLCFPTLHRCTPWITSFGSTISASTIWGSTSP